MNSSATVHLTIPIVPERRQGQAQASSSDFSAPTSQRPGELLDARIEQLRIRLAPLLNDDSASEWGNFGNNWGQGGGFDNFNNFQNGY